VAAGRPQEALASTATLTAEVQGAQEAKARAVAGEAVAPPLHPDAHALEAARRPEADVRDDVEGEAANDCVYDGGSLALEAACFAAKSAEEQRPRHPSKTASGAEASAVWVGGGDGHRGDPTGGSHAGIEEAVLVAERRLAPAPQLQPARGIRKRNGASQRPSLRKKPPSARLRLQALSARRTAMRRNACWASRTPELLGRLRALASAI